MSNTLQQPELRRLIEREHGEGGDDAGAEAEVNPPASQRLPFAQRLRVARRHVGIFGVAADGGEDFPRPRAFGAGGLLDHDGDAGHVVQPERRGGRVVLVTIAFEVMQTSARSISNSVSKIFLSET